MSEMKKIIVIGCPGSGKSMFSKALHEITGIPLYHLDMMNWNADGTNVPKALFRERLNDTLEKDFWIIDGNYGSTMELRMQLCDTIFFLDYPTEVCIEGVRSRKGRERSDMPCIAAEDDDEEFMEFIKNYHIECRPGVYSLLYKNTHKNINIFENRSEADQFLRYLQENKK